MTKKLILHPNQFELEDIHNDDTLFLYPSAFLDKKNIQLRSINEKNLVNLRFSVDQFDQEFNYSNVFTIKLIRELIPILNEYYGVEKSERFWFTLLLADLKEIIEIVYARFLQLHSISDQFSAVMIENCEDFLRYESGRLFYLNTNFISTVDWALSSFIIKNSELINRSNCNFIHVKSIERPMFKKDCFYYDKMVADENNRLVNIRKHWFPYYVSFRANEVSVHLDYDEKINEEFARLGGESKKFFAYYSGFPKFTIWKNKRFFQKIKNRLLGNSENSFESFFIKNIGTFLPNSFLNFRIPQYCNFRFLKIGMPSSSVLEAVSRENGGSFFGIQHGTAYGMYTNGTQEWTERKVSDGFISWGWTGEENQDRIIPFPSPMLSKFIMNEIGDQKKSLNSHLIGVIFNTTYTRVGKFLRVAMPFFLKDNLILLNKTLGILNSLVQKEIVVSEYAYEQGYDLKSQLDEDLVKSADIHFKSMVGERLINESALIVSNSLGTSFFERLVLNKPIIVFNDFFELSNYNDLWKELLDNLIFSEIYLVEEEIFKKRIGGNVDELSTWWYSDRVQNARQMVLNKYLKLDKDWKNIFKEFIQFNLNDLPFKPDSSKVPVFVKFYSWLFFRLKSFSIFK
ncbi:hypothetical protein AB3N60_10010 [Leptospira sp. WS39.C2]